MYVNICMYMCVRIYADIHIFIYIRAGERLLGHGEAEACDLPELREVLELLVRVEPAPGFQL